MRTSRSHGQFTVDSVVTKVDDVSASGNGAASGVEEPLNPESSRSAAARKHSHGDLALFEEDTKAWPTLGGYLRTFTIPGAEEKEAQDQRQTKAKLGMIIGVYLPTIQHIFGVLMFLRLFWIVGTAGALQSLLLVFLCCCCTFLTSISMSAIATNGVVESGGSYFMISRNLGPEFGSAVGILFYLANTVATSMYLVGGVEILLTYVAPSLPQFGESGSHNQLDMFNNFRCYATVLLFIEFLIVAIGVKFVQFFAPVSLSCVIISILSVYVGSFFANADNSPMVCMLGDRLLNHEWIMLNGNVTCNKTLLEEYYCTSGKYDSNSTICMDLQDNDVKYLAALPGYGSGVFTDNLRSSYMAYKEAVPGEQGNEHRDVMQDITTNFFVLLAIYFPSVTGIMTGSNMSGDLADPQKSIPSGTIAAQLTTSFVYLSFTLLFAGTISGPVLRDKYGSSLGGGMVVAKLAWPSEWVLLIGSFTSTFGAALQCLCSAPRLLQSIAKDDVIPILSPFAEVTRFGEPFRALLLTTVIAEGAILIGAIDYIAPVVDFFFLMCYGFVNIVCALQTVMKAPNWRPRFKFFHWSLSLLGALLCFFIMFATYWYYALVTLALCAGIYKYTEWRGAKKEWGDGFRGLALSGAQFSLLKVEDEEQHTKNWRPQILVLMKLDRINRPKYRKLMALSGQLKAGRGLVIAASLVDGDYADPNVRQYALEVKANLKESLKTERVKGFAMSVICRDVSEGMNVLIQSAGIGALKPNTVMVGWPNTWRHQGQISKVYYNFLDAVHRVATADMCLLIPKGIEDFPDYSEKVSGFIDVWWVIHDGGLLVLLPFLLKKHRVWSKCRLRIFAVATLKDNSVKMQEDLNRWIYQLRIAAEVRVVEFHNTDISAYTYEKTMQMEERSRFLQDLRMTDREKEREPQVLLDELRSFKESREAREAAKDGGADSSGSSKHQQLTVVVDGPNAVPLTEIHKPDEKITPNSHLQSPDSPSPNQYTFSPAHLEQLKQQATTAFSTDSDNTDAPSGNASTTDGLLAPGSETSSRRRGVDHKKAKKMHNAVRLNQVIRETSSDASLVIINLPGPPRDPSGLHNYIDYLDALTEGLERVLLVRGTGKEVITIYS